MPQKRSALRQGPEKVKTEDFRAYLIRWLDAKGWTQSDLATQMGVANSTISYWLTGKSRPTDLENLLALEKATGVPLGTWLSLLTGREYNHLKAQAEKLKGGSVEPA